MSKIKTLMLAVVAVVVLALQVHAQAATGFTKINSGTVTGTSFVDGNCPNLSSCYYQVTAVDSGGFESQPSQCNTTTLCLGGNMAVAIMPSSGTHTVTLTWVASSSAVSYNIYRHVGPLPATNLALVIN